MLNLVLFLIAIWILTQLPRGFWIGVAVIIGLILLFLFIDSDFVSKYSLFFLIPLWAFGAYGLSQDTDNFKFIRNLFKST